jgi:hypothetical protein
MNGTVQCVKQGFRPRDPISEESLAWVQSHVDQCLENHEKCAKASEPLLPSRVLCISRTPEGPLHVCLQESRSSRGRYVCLSHRWGGSDKGMLTTESYNVMLKDIPWTEIPKTFQDVIQFVFAIGVQYLWIDTYCIIQGDESDWLRESKRMATIYQSAYITIAATIAQNNESGCFWSTETSYERDIEIESSTSETSGFISVREAIGHWERIWTSNSESRFPLLTRAWVFQERLLSPRVLHFSGKELVWECKERGDCQCGGFDPRANAKRRSLQEDSSWRAAVELYTSLKVTRESDRLPAVFGFAEHYAHTIMSSMDSDYLAGMWRDSLRLDLLWRVESLALISLDPPRRLCRCWDTDMRTSPTDLPFERRCQFSYSAACSNICLKERELCRYGEKSAARAFTALIGGNLCKVGRQEAQNHSTTAKDLQRFEINDRRGSPGHQDISTEPYTPSWSWASAHHKVKYWADVVDVPQRKLDVRKACQIRDVHSDTCLVIDGYLIPAILQYQELSDPKAVYAKEQGEETLVESRFHDILNYALRLIGQHGDEKDLQFYPDTILCLEGAKHIPNRTQVALLHVTYNAYLVLRKRNPGEGSGPCKHGSYQRVGVMRVPSSSLYALYNHTQWVTGIVVR